MITFVAGALVALGGTLAYAGSIDRAAEVDEPAHRSRTQLQVAPTAPPPGECRRVIVIGDSLMDNAEPWLIAELERGGYEFFVDAHHSRRIPAAIREPYSGVTTALTARATFGDAECWVVGLGSNDLIFGGGESVEVSTQLIDEMLAALTPGAHVWWVNVNFHHDPRTGYDMEAATHRFNAALAARDAALADLTVLDWYTLSEANLQWFFDPVHVDRTGSIARAKWTVAALRP